MTENTMPAEKDLAPAVTRSVRIIEFLAGASGPATLTDIARAIGAAKSSTKNLCSVLADNELIDRTEAGFTLGPRLLEFGGAYLRRFDELKAFYRFCADSPVLSHEIVQVAMLDGVHVVYLARHEGSAPLRLTANIGDRFPASSTAVGNALLSALPPAEVERRYANDPVFPQRTERSITSLPELQKALEAVREHGYAYDGGGVHPGVVGLAVTVTPRTAGGTALAVGASLVTPELSDQDRRKVVGELKNLASLLSNPLVEAAHDS
ncbi:IclR family transcriptional regulator [Curtobacterium citreum]|uniref:IclR family transcriptional regulator n=1 Tax=Curtobacterium citreum TaxID=2036 RepID=UPI00254BD3E9|nr:IclR family transcriptional regulator [Curtobacterium citreum]MDK8172273.1 IclR family transcriptional regulator [Curtobacterium citreum]